MGEQQESSTIAPVGKIAEPTPEVPRCDSIETISPILEELTVTFIDFVTEAGQRGWIYVERAEPRGSVYAHLELEHGAAHDVVLEPAQQIGAFRAPKRERLSAPAREMPEIVIDARGHGESLSARGRFDQVTFEIVCQCGDEDADKITQVDDIAGWVKIKGETESIRQARALTSKVSRRRPAEAGDRGRLVVFGSGACISPGFEGWRLEVSQEALSGRTFQSYPVSFVLERPGARIDCEAISPSRELRRIGPANSWSGICRLRRREDGREVQDFGFWTWQASEESSSFAQLIRRANRCALARTKHFLSGQGLERLQSPGTRDLLADPRGPALSTADGNRLLEPIRVIAERGGKGWRGYAVAICCEAVGGDFSQHLDWLAISELLHVGSLIVDDVEDNAESRRGGPSCHVLYGTPIAINAGSLAYFLALSIIQRSVVQPETRDALYAEYSDLLRLGHMGQGLDIELAEFVPGPGTHPRELLVIERCAQRANRLKSGVPARSVARMGAILGNGRPEQIDALGKIFLEVGEAFQLLDDVLNLTGLPGTPGKRGEDLRNSKLTVPVLRALRRAPAAHRRLMLEAVAKAPTEDTAVDFLIEEIERTGVLSECKEEIFHVSTKVEDVLQGVTQDTHARILMQSLITHVLEKFY